MKLSERPQATYLIGAVTVWVSIIAATVVILGGTSHFGEMLPILFLGAVYSIVIFPGGNWHTTVRHNQQGTTGAHSTGTESHDGLTQVSRQSNRHVYLS